MKIHGIRKYELGNVRNKTVNVEIFRSCTVNFTIEGSTRYRNKLV